MDLALWEMKKKEKKAENDWKKQVVGCLEYWVVGYVPSSKLDGYTGMSVQRG